MSKVWDSNEIKMFELTYECEAEDCERKFRMTMTGTTQGANRARNAPPPNCYGWAGGFCPDHVGAE